MNIVSLEFFILQEFLQSYIIDFILIIGIHYNIVFYNLFLYLIIYYDHFFSMSLHADLPNNVFSVAWEIICEYTIQLIAKYSMFAQLNTNA